MRIRSWQAAGLADFKARVLPQIKAILGARGGNATYAGIAVAEAAKMLLGGDNAKGITARSFAIGKDIRIEISSREGRFPAKAKARLLALLAADPSLAAQPYASLPEEAIGGRALWRILRATDYAILAEDGRKATLLFGLPLKKPKASTVGELAARYFLADTDEIIHQ